MPAAAVRVVLLLTLPFVVACGRVDFESVADPDRGVRDAASDGEAPDAGDAGDAGPRDAGGGDAASDSSMIPPDAAVMTRVSVTLSGAGAGRVDSLGGFACTAACAMDVPVGTEVRLTAAANDDSWFSGWSGAPCSGRGECVFTATEDVSIEAGFTARPNRVFVTSAGHDGDFGGLAGADAYCNSLATAAGMTGTWMALLSTATTSGSSRLTGSRGFIRVDGAPVADLRLDRALWYPIRLDENGVDVGEAGTWVAHGGPTTELCADWTSNSSAVNGRSDRADRGWHLATGGGDTPCDGLRRLRCVETGRNVVVAPAPTLGRGAFTTAAEWTPGGGFADADAFCAGEAAGAGRAGVYRAFLATDGAAGIARFADGPPWIRPDGVPLLPTVGAWRTASYFDVAPALDATGGALLYHTLFTGASGLAGVGTAAGTCSDWTVTTGNSSISVATWDTRATGGGLGSCVSPRRLLCLEE